MRQSKNIYNLWILIASVIIMTSFFLIPRIRKNIQKTQAATPAVIFPQDHGQHTSYKSEWWYINLLTHTKKQDGTGLKDLGYVLSFSRINNINGLLSSRYDNSNKNFREKTNVNGSLSVTLPSGRLKVVYSKDSISLTLEEISAASNGAKRYKLTGTTPEIGRFNLALQERTVNSTGANTPLLWGGTTGNCKGKISVFSDNDTYYYSIPDLDITGTITDIDGSARNVAAGKAWIDHQWFNTLPPSDWLGHYWTSFHYTTGNSVYDPGPHQAFGVVTQVYGTSAKYSYWVKRNSNGTNECGIDAKFLTTAYTANNFPISWVIETKQGTNPVIKANAQAFSPNQVFSPPIGVSFFEPAAYFSGQAGGKSVTGLGFLETSRKQTSQLVCGSWESLRINDCTLSGFESTTKSAYCYTSSQTVNLNMNSPGATQMRFREVTDTSKYCENIDNNNWTSWETIKSSRGWNLTSGVGNKKVCVQFKNAFSTTPKCGAMITRR